MPSNSRAVHIGSRGFSDNSYTGYHFTPKILENEGIEIGQSFRGLINVFQKGKLLEDKTRLTNQSSTLFIETPHGTIFELKLKAPVNQTESQLSVYLDGECLVRDSYVRLFPGSKDTKLKEAIQTEIKRIIDSETAEKERIKEAEKAYKKKSTPDSDSSPRITQVESKRPSGLHAIVSGRKVKREETSSTGKHSIS